MSGGKRHVSDLSWTVTLTATNAYLLGKAKSKKKKKKKNQVSIRHPDKKNILRKFPLCPGFRLSPLHPLLPTGLHSSLTTSLQNSYTRRRDVFLTG